MHVWTRAQSKHLVSKAMPRNQGRVTTVIEVLTLQGFTVHPEMEDGTSLEVWGRCVLERRVPVLQPGHVIVWDNLAVHRCRALIDVIESRCTRVVFLPPTVPPSAPSSRRGAS